MKILLSFLFVLLTTFGFSQSILPLRADTVLIEKTGGSGELKIKNSTRDSLGALVNMGGGKTRFMRVRVLNDSTFIMPPNDTIVIRGAVPVTFYTGDGSIAGTRTVDFETTGILNFSDLLATTISSSRFGIQGQPAHLLMQHFETNGHRQELYLGNLAHEGSRWQVLNGSTSIGIGLDTLNKLIINGLNIGGGASSDSSLYINPATGVVRYGPKPTGVVGGSGTVNSGTQYQLAYYAINGTEVSGLTLITANRAIVSNANGLPVAATTTATEIGYVNGVTSGIQAQIDSKTNNTDTAAMLENYVTESELADTAAVKNFKLGWFNVKDFGAVGDSLTDDTAPIQAAILAAKAHKGGVIYFPNGFYRVGGAIIANVGGRPCNCQIYIPFTPVDSALVIHFLGETPGDFELQGVIEINPPKSGVIIESSLASATAGQSMIGVVKGPTDDTFGKTNQTDPWFQNINFRVRRDIGALPLTGLNLTYASKIKINDVKVDINVPLWVSPDPTGTGSYGIMLPEKSNHASIDMGTVRIAGFDIGLLLGEHTVAKDLQIVANNVGISVINGDHSSSIQTLEVELNKTNIRVDGDQNVMISNYNSEHYNGILGTRWFDIVSDITFSSYTPYAGQRGLITLGNSNVAISGTAGESIAFITNDSSRVWMLTRNHMALKSGVFKRTEQSYSVQIGELSDLHNAPVLLFKSKIAASGSSKAAYYMDGTGELIFSRFDDDVTALGEKKVFNILPNANWTFMDTASALTLLTSDSSDRIATTAWAKRVGIGPGGSAGSLQQVTDIGSTTDNNITILNNQNGATGLEIQNPNTGAGAESYMAIRNDVGFGALEILGSGVSNGNRAFFSTSSAVTGGLAFLTLGAAPIKFHTNSDGSSNERMRINSAGEVNIGNFTDQGGFTLQNTGNLYQNGLVQLMAVPTGTLSMSILLHGDDSLIYKIPASSFFTNPMTTAGDIIVGGASGVPARLGIGTANQILGVNNGTTAQEYKTVTGGNGVTVTHGAGSITLSTDGADLFEYSTYTPTLTNAANLSASTVPDVLNYEYNKITSTVKVWGYVTVDPTLTATSTSLGISLPVTSTFSNIGVLSGTAFASGITGQGAAIRADTGNSRAEMIWIATDISSQPMHFSFTYKVTPP